MSWATRLIEDLKQGKTVSFRPKGNSMLPVIKSGQLCTCVPVNSDMNIEVGQVVLCKIKGNQYLHKVTAIRDSQYQISNNHGYVNGWTSRSQIFGLLTEVSD